MDFIIDEIFRRYDVLRYKNEKLLLLRTDEIYEKIPAVKELDNDISKKRMELLHNITNTELDFEREQKKIDELVLKKRSLLKKNGYCETYLNPIYRCETCRDTGIDEKNGSRCVCFNNALQALKYKDLKFGADDASFESFNINIFPDDEEVFKERTQKKNMLSVYDSSLKFSNSFPYTKKLNIVFSGASGLGKTYLLKCIVKRIIERGFSCLYITSYNLFEQFRKYYFGELDDLKDFYTVPLLIIDDLGTEPLMKNVTSESFFTLLIERHNRNIHTLFATNLSPDDIHDRYGERIFSRLLSFDDTDLFNFAGTDVRFIKKK